MRLKIIDILREDYGFDSFLSAENLTTFISDNLSDKQLFGLVKKAQFNHSSIVKGVIPKKDIYERNEMINILSYLFNSVLYKSYYKEHSLSTLFRE